MSSRHFITDEEFKSRLKGEKFAAERCRVKSGAWQIAKLIHGDKALKIKKKLLHFNGINVEWVEM